MNIYSIYDNRFKPYGRVLSGFDTEQLIRTLCSVTPMPTGVVYTPLQPELQELDITTQLQNRFFGGLPIQMGWCNGMNTRLNCLEYHRSSEINLGATDYILLVGKQTDIGEDGLYDTEACEAFYVPAGEMVELFATTLHYARCSARRRQGFRVLVVLPNGTNREKPGITPKSREDTLLTACNKWLLAHPDSDEAHAGAVIGLKGENIDIEQNIKEEGKYYDGE